MLLKVNTKGGIIKMRKVNGRKTMDLNALARQGLFFCATCGEKIRKDNDTGHCLKCRMKGY